MSSSYPSFLDEMRKLGKLRTELLPHQQRVVGRIQETDQPGLLVIHGLGSGKTLTSIAAQDALRMHAQVVAPAALLGNYQKERAKHIVGKSQKTDMVSMQGMATKGVFPSAPLLIVDEAHRARDPGSATFQTLKGNTSQKRILLSGSPFYNHPSDIASLINLAADAKVLPHDKNDFTRKFISEKVIKPGMADRFANFFRSAENEVKSGVVPILYDKAAPELKDAFKKWVDYHPGSTKDFPTIERKTVTVPMTDAQLKVYDTLMDKAPAWVAAKVKRGLPPNKQEAQQLNAFLGAVRQVSNTTRPYSTDKAEEPKIHAAFDSLQTMLKSNPRAKGVVFSNYLDAGIKPYKDKLDAAKIPYGEFTGDVKPKERDQIVKDYNSGKIRTLLLSSAGGEGLDLKGTSMLQVLDPHWNQEKLKQVEGRGARYMSHSHLPKAEQKLLVENYLATRPNGIVSRALNAVVGREPDKSVDQYLTQMSDDKEKLINQFRALLPGAEKKAAKSPDATARSKEIANSWKPMIAREAKYTLPGAVMGANIGHLLVRNVGGDGRVGAAMGALAGGWLGHSVGGVMPSTLQEGKNLARQAAKSPQKENYLRENSEKMDWGHIGSAALARAIQSTPAIFNAVISGNPELKALAATSVAAGAISAAGSGYLDKYHRMVAVNEIDNAKLQLEGAAAEKLRKLRRQVSALEAQVEGDGWKTHAISTDTHAKTPQPKDKSGKSW
jgi:superfamily II DNA or RNA helicase